MSVPMYDLLLDENGDIPKTPAILRGDEIVAQRVRRRLFTHRGEWLLDTRVGVPYIRWREQKNPRTENISAFVRALIVETPGVISLREFRVEFKPETHTVKFYGRIIVDGGAMLSFDGSVVPVGDNVSGSIIFNTTSGAIL